jgi:hypothetical protein
MAPPVLSVSWSRLKAYEECRQKVLRTMQGRSSGVKNGRIFLPGTLADRAMRRWLEEDDPQPGGMHAHVPELFEEHTGEDAEYIIKWRGDVAADKRAVRDQVRECLDNLEPLLVEKVLPFRYQPELKFRTTIGIPYLDGEPVRVDLIGGIDIVVQDDEDNFGIFDLKNTRNDAYVRGATLGQLTFYTIAWGAYIGDPAQPKQAAFLTPLCQEKYVPVVVGPEERRVMMARLTEYCHGVWREEWTPTDVDSFCYNCDVKHACDRFALPTTGTAGKNRASFAAASAARSTYAKKRESDDNNASGVAELTGTGG